MNAENVGAIVGKVVAGVIVDEHHCAITFTDGSCIECAGGQVSEELWTEYTEPDH